MSRNGGGTSELGRLVRQLRERQRPRLSQAGLAERTGWLVKASHIARIETGSLGATRAKIEALAEALGATGAERDQLLAAAGHEGDPEPSTRDRLDALEQQYGELSDRVERLEQRDSPG